MNRVDSILHRMSGGKVRQMTFADLAMEFCNLPRHREMSAAFVAGRGRCDRDEFLARFNAPGWAYDFLCAMTGDVRVRLYAMRQAKAEGYGLGWPVDFRDAV